MLKTQNLTVEENINYKELAEARLEIIEMKNEKIELLSQEVNKLKNARK